MAIYVQVEELNVPSTHDLIKRNQLTCINISLSESRFRSIDF